MKRTILKTMAGVLALGWLLACGGDDETEPAPQQPAAGSGGGGQAGEAGAAGQSQAGAAGEAGSGGAAGQAGSGGAMTAEQYCQAGCDAAATAGCDNQPTNCVQSCMTAGEAAPWCDDVFLASVRCIAEQPASAYTCGENGVAALPPMTCQQEAEALVDCVWNGPASGLPDMTADCEAACSKQQGLECAKPNCVQLCQQATTEGIDQNGACAGAAAVYFHCAANLQASEFVCTGAGNPSAPPCQPMANFSVACLADYCADHPEAAACQTGAE